MDREKIIEKLEKEVKRTYTIKSAVWEFCENSYKKISEEITEHREPGVKISMEMADEILALLKEEEIDGKIKGRRMSAAESMGMLFDDPLEAEELVRVNKKKAAQ